MPIRLKAGKPTDDFEAAASSSGLLWIKPIPAPLD
jgi:hypothetical protein